MTLHFAFMDLFASLILPRRRRERPRRRATEQRDELAPLQVIEHSVPSQSRIAGYRIGEDRSAGDGAIST